MATKSVLKTVYIKDNKTAGRLAFALENAQNKPSREVKIPGSVRTVSGDDVRRLFEGQA